MRTKDLRLFAELFSNKAELKVDFTQAMVDAYRAKPNIETYKSTKEFFVAVLKDGLDRLTEKEVSLTNLFNLYQFFEKDTEDRMGVIIQIIDITMDMYGSKASVESFDEGLRWTLRECLV